jgi:serine/threonine protein phosphatase PrpC
MITASGATHTGHVRRINEDAFLCDVDLGLFIVGDGMGGHHAGEVASTLAVEAIRAFLARTFQGEELTWPYGIDPTLSFDGNRVLTALRLANRRVFKEGESHEDYSGMGTTIVVGLFVDNRIVFSSVGDSRIYCLADGTLAQLTEDDTWVRMMAGRGDVDRAAAPNHPMRHVLTNVVGARDQIECRIVEQTLDREATFLFATDGLHDLVEPEAIAAVLGSGKPPALAAEQLIQEALERGGHDNITALVVQYRP